MPDRIRLTTDGIVVVDLTHGDAPNILYLSQEEARSISEILNTGIRQRTEPGAEVIILDSVLPVAEAQAVANHLDRILAEANRRCQEESQKVNWQQEGF